MSTTTIFSKIDHFVKINNDEKVILELKNMGEIILENTLGVWWGKTELNKSLKECDIIKQIELRD